MPQYASELTGLIRVLKYYSFFRYAATAEDIYLVYPYKVTKKQFDLILAQAVKDKRILTEKIAQTSYYTLPSHGIALHEVEKKINVTSEKLLRIETFLSVIKYCAPVALIGLSGSLAMQNAGRNDDIDFFVISMPGRVWTARLLLLALASFLGMRRKRGEKSPSGKVCLNLFFDGSDLQVPVQKRNVYVAHEIVHMKPLYVKGDVYERFLQENEWIYEYFPNFNVAQYRVRRVNGDLPPKSYLAGPDDLRTGIFAPLTLLEALFKQFQLYFINKHRTNELVSNTQMWFYPDDFEEKLRKSKMI